MAGKQKNEKIHDAYRHTNDQPLHHCTELFRMERSRLTLFIITFQFLQLLFHLHFHFHFQNLNLQVLLIFQLWQMKRNWWYRFDVGILRKDALRLLTEFVEWFWHPCTGKSLRCFEMSWGDSYDCLELNIEPLKRKKHSYQQSFYNSPVSLVGRKLWWAFTND